MTSNKWPRRSLITGLGATVAAAAISPVSLAARGRTRAQAPSGFAPVRHDRDAWMDELPGKHRVFVDSASGAGGGDALLYANNLFRANQAGYDLGADEIATIVCFRHASTPYGYNDAMWAKYGDALAAYTGSGDGEDSTPDRNPHMSQGSRVSPTSIDGLSSRGVHFAICDMATLNASRRIARAVDGDADAIYAELIANAVPNGHFVPAGVVAMTRAQEYGYSLLVAG